MNVEITVLGRTTVRRDGVEVDLGGRRPTEIVALLVAAGGAVVDAGVLADQLWRGEPPASARTTLQGYVARMRRGIEPGVAAGDAQILQTRGTGYRIVLPEESVDAGRFALAVRRCVELHDAGRTTQIPALLQPALEQWGDPLAEVADVPDVGPVAARLAELHLVAVELLAEARLSGAGDPRTVGDLLLPAAAHPLREKLQLLLARALYRVGRQGEALEVLRRTRAHLADELGIDPSPQLRALEEAMLRQDPDLAASGPVDRPPSSGPPSGPPSDASSNSKTAAPADGFVGRDEPLAELDRAWTSARAGRGRVVVISGEPGIGKTALVEAFLARHPAATARWGRWPQTPGVPPYWAWQQVVGGLPATQADAGGRFALGLDIARRLAAEASTAPDGGLVVVLDDVQWADADSLHVLDVVLGELNRSPVLLVLTVRADATGPDLTRALAGAARSPGSVRLDLRPLGDAEVAALAGRLSGRKWTPEESSALTERSGGNPFFVTELARPSGPALPGSVRDVIRARLAGLGDDALTVAQTVTVAGRDLSPGLAAAATGLDLDRVEVAVEEAVREGVLRISPARQLALAHALLGEVLLDDLGAARRADLHLRLAATLEAGATAATSAAAIAWHRSEAAAAGPSTSAATACLRAAREAFERSAESEAVTFAERGLVHAADGTATAADLLLVLGRARRRLGHLEEGTEHLRAAADAARSLGDDVRLAQAALAAAADGIGGFWGAMAAIGATDPGLLAEAVARGPALPDHLHSALLSATAVQRASKGYDAEDLPERALRLAGTDRAARVRAMVADYVAHWSPAWARHRLDLVRRMQAEVGEDPAYDGTVLHLLRCSLFETGSRDEAEAVSRRYAELAQRRGAGDHLLLQLWWDVGMALARGDYDEARALGDRAVAEAPTVSPAAAAMGRLSRETVEGIAAWHERRLPDLIPNITDVATLDQDFLIVVAQAHAQAGRRDEALAVAERFRTHPSKGVREMVHTLLLADVYVELRDAERAATMLERLESYGDAIVVMWAGLTVVGPVAFHRGALKKVLGRPDADDDLRRGLVQAEHFGMRPFVRRTREWLAT
ncbi:BTAD domain-containing putative transcriptional regulator [Spongisporangium articulatum]|uniref:BTAD domain-containing putative transcriptional regulator n=1 Tax=Spongisporangium articulatum TaxID=3362603 RepID=A0ABW8AN29_9ACTN